MSGRGSGGRGGRGGYEGGGRGGGGRGPMPPSSSAAASSPNEGMANLLYVSLTPTFKFYQYTVDISDKNGKLIDSSSHRSRLFYKYFLDETKGYLAKVLKLPPDEIKDLSRTIFFQGSFFFASRPIPGLVHFPATVVGLSSSDDAVGPAEDGEIISINELFCFNPPTELGGGTTAAGGPTTGQEPVVQLCMDRRCSGCTMAFTDLHALMAHCSIKGHAPEYQTSQLNAQPATIPVLINYCNVALQHAMSERMLRWGKSYVEPNKGKELTDKDGKGLGIDLYRAYNCDFSVVKPRNQPMTLALTVDLRAKIIRKKSLLDYLYEDRGLQTPGVSLDINKQNRLKQELIGEIVIATYDKKCYVIQDLLFDRSPATHIINDKKISHEEYFKTAKNIQLKYPKVAPMVAVEGRQKQIIFLPAELVAINELDPRIKQKLPLIASFPAKDRIEAIEEIKRYFVPGAQRTRGVGGGLLPAVGIQIQTNQIKIALEYLPLPAIVAAKIQVPPSMGASWAPMFAKADYSINPREAVMLNVLLVAHQSIGNPLVVFNRVRDMVNKMNASYRFPDSATTVKVGDKEKHWGAVERHFSSKQPPNLFVIDLCKPAKGQINDPAYSVVKHILSKGGYLSQFINFNTYDHENPRDFYKSETILANVARQVLSKCGFRVWWVNIPREIPLPAVFIGVDVFHAPKKYDAKLKQRVAKESVVAIVVQVIRSHDSERNKKVEVYSKTFRRTSGLEMNVGPNLKTTVEEAIRILKVDPLSCVVWRDGVSDQMMKPVSRDEIQNLRQAFSGSRVIGLPSDKPPASVAISYMVVQKRIATKFFTSNGEAVSCGALVTSLQTADYATFYINGTAPKFSFPKPARYTIVQMDKEFGPNKNVLASLSWALCHDYPNWTGPIKLPSPTQNAHVLAELAGQFPDNGDSINAAAYANKLYFI